MPIATLGTVIASLNPVGSLILMIVRIARGLLSVQSFGDHPTVVVETLPTFAGCHNNVCPEPVVISPEAATPTMVESIGQVGFGATPNLAPAPPTQQIFVKTHTGATVTVDIAAHDAVKDVKLRISAKTLIPPELHSLSFAGKQLEDAQPLTVYGIQKESTLHLALRLRGGMGKRKSDGASARPIPKRRPPQESCLPPQRIRGSVTFDPSWQEAPPWPRVQRKIDALHIQRAAQARQIDELQTAPAAASSVGSKEDMEIVPTPCDVEQPLTEQDRVTLQADLTQVQSAASTIEGVAGMEALHAQLRRHAKKLELCLQQSNPPWWRPDLLAAIKRRMEAADNARKLLATLDAEIVSLKRELHTLQDE